MLRMPWRSFSFRGMSTSGHPIEQLLRPPHEMPVGLAYLAAAVLVAQSPGVLLGAIHTPALTGAVTFGLLLRSGQRMYHACRLMKYQYALHVLPEYRIRSVDIPVSPIDLFLGMGFEWRARHTQRATDIDRLTFDYHKNRDQSWSYKTVRRLEKSLRAIPLAAAIAVITSFQHWINPLAPIPYVEGNPATHAVGLWEGERPVIEKQTERVAHKFVVGTTRVGKTRLAEILITQDIHNNEVVIVFDPKGDPDLLKRMWIEAKRAGRLHQFYCFHLGFPQISARYNPIGTFGRITEPASRIASQLPSEGNSAAFREFTWRYVNVMSKALTTLGKTITYETLLHYGGDIDPLLREYLEFIFNNNAPALEKNGILNWKKAVDQIVDNDDLKQDKATKDRDRRAWAMGQLYKASGIADPVAGSLLKTFEYEKSFYDRLVASLFPLLEKLTSGPTSALLSPDYTDLDDPRPIFDWDEVIRTGGIVYVGLDALSDAEVSQAVGNSMFSDLTSRAGAIYKGGLGIGLPPDLAAKVRKRKICIHADEFNELVGREFIPMANKAGGAGFQLTVYTQTLSDIKARFGNAAKAGQVVGNLGNLIMLRVKELETARLLTDQLPQVEVNHLTTMSGATDDANPDSVVDFTSSTQQRITTQRVPMISPGDLTRLPKGHAFALLGGRLYKLRIPQLKDDDDLPADISFMCSDMAPKHRAANDLAWAQLPEISWRSAA
jgi:conjugative coupling factor TraD (TOL family)